MAVKSVTVPRDRHLPRGQTGNIPVAIGRDRAYNGTYRQQDAGEPVFDGIASRHAYIVTGTTTEMQGEKTIYYVRVRYLWNGYGVNYVEKNGKIEAVQDKSDVNKGETE